MPRRSVRSGDACASSAPAAQGETARRGLERSVNQRNRGPPKGRTCLRSETAGWLRSSDPGMSTQIPRCLAGGDRGVRRLLEAIAGRRRGVRGRRAVTDSGEAVAARGEEPCRRALRGARCLGARSARSCAVGARASLLMALDEPRIRRRHRRRHGVKSVTVSFLGASASGTSGAHVAVESDAGARTRRGTVNGSSKP